MRVVFDAGVVLAGAGWRNESYRCLVLAAKRIALPYATAETLAELRRVAADMHSRGVFQHRDPLAHNRALASGSPMHNHALQREQAAQHGFDLL